MRSFWLVQAAAQLTETDDGLSSLRGLVRHGESARGGPGKRRGIGAFDRVGHRVFRLNHAAFNMLRERWAEASLDLVADVGKIIDIQKLKHVPTAVRVSN